jgi:hypothetical protein
MSYHGCSLARSLWPGVPFRNFRRTKILWSPALESCPEYLLGISRADFARSANEYRRLFHSGRRWEPVPAEYWSTVVG